MKVKANFNHIAGRPKGQTGFDARMILNRKRKAGVTDLSEKLHRTRRSQTQSLNWSGRPGIRLNPANNPIFSRTIENHVAASVPKAIHNFKVRITNDKFSPGATSKSSSVLSTQKRKLRISVPNAEVRQNTIRRIANTLPTSTFNRSLQQLQRRNENPTSSKTFGPISLSPAVVQKPTGITSSRLSEAKVSVRNLHPEVSEEDIMELFGSAGALKSAKLLRPGTAEVVFFTAKEAIKAIEMYDQRELDGFPMQCGLVSVLARSSEDSRHSTGKIRTKSVEMTKKHEELSMDVDEMPVSSQAKKELIPDRGLIAEVLFNKKLNTRPVTFTVKV